MIDIPPRTDYIADGTGRDTYIRRDPTATYGKVDYRPEQRVITRFGTSGQELPRDLSVRYNGFRPGQRNEVGGLNPAQEFSRTDRFLNTKTATEFPVAVTKYTTMKEICQDRMVTAQRMPGHLNHIAGYKGFQPRAPQEAATWQSTAASATEEPAPTEEEQ